MRTARLLLVILLCLRVLVYAQSAPTLTAISPSSGSPGTALAVTITGTNFTSDAVVTSFNSTVTVSNVVVVSSTQITATFTVATDPLWAGMASVTTSAGESNRLFFYVTSPNAPMITRLSPANGNRGDTWLDVMVYGDRFTSGMTATVDNPGITVEWVDLYSGSAASVGLTIAANAAPGPVNLRLTSGAGTSAPATFTVNTPPPTFTSIAPASGFQGATVPVTLTGTNFFAGSTVATNNPGIAVGGVSVVSETQITASFAIAANANLGAANVTVTTLGGTTSAVSFTVAPPPPTLTSVSPASGAQAASVPLTLTGASFLTGATVATGNPGITVNNVSVTSSTQITATFTIAANAATGPANITVTTANGTSAPVTFAVTPPPPGITNLLPTSGAVGSVVVINGTGFGASQGSSKVTFNSVDAGAASSWADTSITVTVPSAATTGNVVVTVGTLSSAGTPFTVTVPPAITNVWPRSGAVQTGVTISGNNFGAARGASTVSFGGVNATSVPYWSDTSITAVVPVGAVSGAVVVTIDGMTATGPTFTVANPPVVSGLSAASGAPGDTITISGAGFGAQQGVGQVWLGSAYGIVVSWSDTQIVATLASTSRTGAVKVLQSGVWSNALPFTVNTVTITEVLPSSGYPGDAIAINGTNFGNSQGTGTVQLGSTNGLVVSWSDTQIMARVAASAVSGIARVQQGGVLSNALTFTVLGGGSGSVVTMAPNLLNMVVGDTHAIQALDASSRPVTGLTWTSSDPTKVSVSTSEPIVLTALAVGHVTVTAGGASADVTVWDPGTGQPGTGLPPGTVLWSNPGNGSGVYKIVPAIPSPTGVADVFAIGNDGSIQAITADGITAWTATTGLDPQNLAAVPDFQGGVLVGPKFGGAFKKLDGITGQAYPSFCDENCGVPAVHPDGTIFMLTGADWRRAAFLTGFDSITGATKFTVPLPTASCNSDFNDCFSFPFNPFIAGDGYAYAAIKLADSSGMRVVVARADTSGGSTQIVAKQWNVAYSFANNVLCHFITNADQGIVLTWRAFWATDPNDPFPILAGEDGMATITGTSVSTFSLPTFSSNDVDAMFPFLQTQDGGFVGTVSAGNAASMVAFDANGNIRWSIPGWWQPEIATADGGVIATEYDGPYGYSSDVGRGWDGYANPIATVTFDPYGAETGQMASLPILSWRGNAYQQGSVERLSSAPLLMAQSLWAQSGGSPSQNRTAARPWYFKLVWLNNCAAQSPPCGFVLYPDNPEALPNLSIDATSQATTIKVAALTALKKAFDQYPVNASEGSDGTGDHRVKVIDGYDINNPCGRTVPLPGIKTSDVFYLASMEQAQWALPILLTTSQDVQNALGRLDLMKAIGTGIGENAAHEVGHQFLLGSSGMDDNSTNTYNSKGCDGDRAPWVYGKGPVNWEDVTQQALKNILGTGWHK